MNGLKTFFMVVLAVLGALLIYDAYQSYSSTHLLLDIRRIQFAPEAGGGDTEHVQVVVVPSLFHRADVHVYSIALSWRMTEDGWETTPAFDGRVEEGLDFIAIADVTPDRALLYKFVCTDKVLTTWEQVESESWNPYLDNDLFIEPSTSILGNYDLQCK